MIKIPNFVLNHLIDNNHIGKTRTLIIGENYPGQNYASTYFYRSIPNCPGGPAVGAPGAFFNNLCNVLLVPHLNFSGGKLTEFERLNKFLESGFLLIDAQDNLITPQNPAALTPGQIHDLIYTILLINPQNIIFLTENNQNVIQSINGHHLFARIQPKIIHNFLRDRDWFCFPSAPANPHLFPEEIEFARKYYFI